MPASSHRSRGVVAAFATLLGVVLAATPVGATGSSGPAYRADIAPTSVAAGRSSTLVITLKQLSSSSGKKVHSVRVTAPDGIAVTDATASKGSSSLPVTSSASVVTVGSIPFSSSGQTATVTLTVAVPCGLGGSRTWTVVGKNGNDFETGGSALTQDPAGQLTTSVTRCSLAFVEQPADAGRDKVITSITADPGGTPIKVRLRDGNGDPASQSGVSVSLAIVSGTGASSATLGGSTSDTTNSNGVASFAPRIDRTADGYRLEASASGIIGSDPSRAFDISDVAMVCAGQCSGTTSRGGTTTTIDANSAGGVLTFSLGTTTVDCDNKANLWYKGTSAPVEWDVTSGNGRTTVTIELDRSDANRPFLFYDVCFSSPESRFKNKFGRWIEKGEAGLLPLCLLTIRRADQPCVVAKWIDRDRDIHVRFSVPPGDPRGRI
jgi:adhesin/invasin